MEGQPITQQHYQPTPEQLEMREAAHVLICQAEGGEISSVAHVDPRKVSPEGLQQARIILHRKKVLAGEAMGRISGLRDVTI